MKKVYYDNQPSPIEAVGNGSYLYRWGIEQISIEMLDTEELGTMWQCHQITVAATPTADLIFSRVFDALWGNGRELKLINDYNASLAGFLDEQAAQPYLDFLGERQALKVQITNDIAQWTNAI